MRKLIVSVLAVGAMTAGGAASAQDLGAVIGSLFGLAPQVYGTVPYGSSPVFVDQYGRQVYIDQYGRQVLAQRETSPQYDAYGRSVYQAPDGSYQLALGDRDGDGVPNQYDRFPTNPFYR